MKITQIRLGKLSVPLRVPFKTALRTVERVEDIVVELHTDTGAVGYGEAPPTAVITGDQVVHSKPDPEIYLLACQALGTAPAHTPAIEDSRNGILSAHSAGMPVIMVPDMIPPTPELEALLFRRCAHLGEVQQLFAQLLA